MELDLQSRCLSVLVVHFDGVGAGDPRVDPGDVDLVLGSDLEELLLQELWYQLALPLPLHAVRSGDVDGDYVGGGEDCEEELSSLVGVREIDSVVFHSHQHNLWHCKEATKQAAQQTSFTFPIAAL